MYSWVQSQLADGYATVRQRDTGLSCPIAWLFRDPSSHGSMGQARVPPSQHLKHTLGSPVPCPCPTWAAAAPVPVSPGPGCSFSLPGTPGQQAQSKEGGTRFPLSSCAGRSSPGEQLWPERTTVCLRALWSLPSSEGGVCSNRFPALRDCFNPLKIIWDKIDLEQFLSVLVFIVFYLFCSPNITSSFPSEGCHASSLTVFGICSVQR